MKNKIYSPHLSTAKDARALRTRQALRQAMLQLLNCKPLDQITILDIVATAKIGYTTFFRHHPTKESLLNDVAAEQMRRLIELVLPVSTAEIGPATSETLFGYVEDQRPMWSTLLTGGAAGALRDELLRIAGDIAASRPEPNRWPPTEVGMLISVSGTIELLAWWLRQADPLSIEEMAEIHNRLVIMPAIQNGFQRPKPRPLQR